LATFRDFPFALADAALELLPAAEAEADFDAPEPCLLADALWLPCSDALAEVPAGPLVWAPTEVLLLPWLLADAWAFVDIPSASTTSARIP
jgi:hypothetical protein